VDSTVSGGHSVSIPKDPETRLPPGIQSIAVTPFEVDEKSGGDVSPAASDMLRGMLLEEAAASDAERNAGHFDLYVLLSLEGDTEKAEEHLRKAGE